jgi:hypothetical protein
MDTAFEAKPYTGKTAFAQWAEYVMPREQTSAI